MSASKKQTFHLPAYTEIERDEMYLFIDHETPNWVVTDKRGSSIIKNINDYKTFEDLIYNYANSNNVDLTKAWVEVDSMINDLERAHFISKKPLTTPAYTGRKDHIKVDKLNELWIHTNNVCNLTCSHCLVGSSPTGDKGLPSDKIKFIIDSAIELGTNRFYFTGGEPFMRKDIFELISYICEDKKRELIILTNATLLKDGNIEKLKNFNKDMLKLQVSLDGPSPEINDPLRGDNSFNQIVQGIKNIINIGFAPTVTTAITNKNVNHVEATTRLLSELDVKTHHLLWAHKRGRVSTDGIDFFVPNEKLIETTLNVKRVADKLNITLDNIDAYKYRANSVKGTRYDLGNACYDSLCVYSDGAVYPSAAFAGHDTLNCGNLFESTLKDIWENSPITNAFRNATLNNKEKCKICHSKYICGGGDIEHSFFYSDNGTTIEDGTYPKNAAIHAHDPYCALHDEMISNAIFELAKERKDMFKRKTGFNSPVVLRSMGEDVVDCAAANKQNVEVEAGANDNNHNINVRTLHSTCVLSFDVDKPRKSVRDFYGKAAEAPQEELCCPTKSDPQDTSHIPQDVIDRFYGCGSPINMANLIEGEKMVDLGSGAGIDCFIAAKKVGKRGNVYGIDMTDEMLKVANENKPIVAKNLGYDVVEFRKGFLEEIPVEDRSIDLVTSNCVVNLSPDKKSVFGEIWRILKDHGRIVISDIVSVKETPAHMQANKQLWGECISGSLTEDEFIIYLEQIGFYGIETLKKVFWKEVEGYQFYSITVRGYKLEKKEGCVYIGQKAIYHGPLKAAIDEEGHLFPRNKEIVICTDTAAKLSKAPYAGQFTVIEPAKAKTEFSCCAPSVGEKGSCC